MIVLEEFLWGGNNKACMYAYMYVLYVINCTSQTIFEIK